MIVVTTLAGGGVRDHVLAALVSAAPLADVFLLLDTGITDNAVQAARELFGVRVERRPFTWTGSFADGRNAALDEASKLGATWAVTLDTDERLHGDVAAFRRELETTAAGAVLAPVDGGYLKDRAFRLPCPLRWRGRVHEAIETHRLQRVTTSTISVTETRKSAEEFQRKFQRDEAALLLEVTEAPRDPRWRYYLGATLSSLGRKEEALLEFMHCAELGGWDEEGAWACYRAAEILCVDMARYEDAIHWCSAGMKRHAGIEELPWLAAVASFRLGRYEQAVCWANVALGVIGAECPRIGFRLRGARFLPYDVLRCALAKLGRAADAREATKLWAARIQ